MSALPLKEISQKEILAQQLSYLTQREKELAKMIDAKSVPPGQLLAMQSELNRIHAEISSVSGKAKTKVEQSKIEKQKTVKPITSQEDDDKEEKEEENVEEFSQTEFKDLDQLNDLIGKPETEEIEFKGSLLSMKSMIKAVTSFMNGRKKQGYIILGVMEDQNTHLTSKIEGITFPYELYEEEENKQILDKDRHKFAEHVLKTHAPKPGLALSTPVTTARDLVKNYKDGSQQKKWIVKNVEAYGQKMLNWLEQKISVPLSVASKGGLSADFKKLVSFNSIKVRDKAFVVVIKIGRSVLRPICDAFNKKFFIRRPESSLGKGDARSDQMTDDELRNEIILRSHRFPKIPIYHEEAFADDELKKLFDAIYNQVSLKEIKEIISEAPQVINSTDSFGNTALFIASIYGSVELVHMLVEEFDMSIYASNKDGWTALHNAVNGNNLEIAHYLVSRNKYMLKQTDKWGYTPCLLAALYGYRKLFMYLHKMNSTESYLLSPSQEGHTALFAAIYGGRLKFIKFLLSDERIKKEIIKSQLTPAVQIAKNYRERKIFNFLKQIKAEVDESAVLGPNYPYPEFLNSIESSFRKASEFVGTLFPVAYSPFASMSTDKDGSTSPSSSSSSNSSDFFSRLRSSIPDIPDVCSGGWAYPTHSKSKNEEEG